MPAEEGKEGCMAKVRVWFWSFVKKAVAMRDK